MRKIISALLTGAAMLCLAGCAGSSVPAETAAPAATCFAIANTANSQGLNLTSPAVQDRAYETVAGYGFISVVSIDGSPEILMADSFDIPEKYKSASREKLQKDAETNTAALLEGLQGITPNDPEADYLEGLRLAARSLSEGACSGEKTIVMVGTGLSTAGTLDFRNNLLSAEPEMILQELKDRQEIPNLSGITVVWQQLGDTAAPQQPLTQSQKLRLQEIWRGIVELGGGSFQCSDSIPVASSGGERPPVSPVELPAQLPIRYEPQETETPDLLREPVMLTEEQVTFVGDQAVYRNPEEASETIAPIADYLSRNPGVSILLVGTTAGDVTNDYTEKLSRDRADAVRSTLMELGISGDRIRTVGLGSSDPWHIAGAGVEGELASANRKVVILDAESPAAKQIMTEE